MRTCATVKHRRGLVSMAWGGDVVEGGSRTQKNLDSACATIIINNYYYFKTPFLQKVRGRGSNYYYCQKNGVGGVCMFKDRRRGVAIKVIRGELEGNRDAAIKLIDAGFNKLLRAIQKRRDALKKMVNDAYTEKDAVLNTQITELEGIDSHSEMAMQLVEAALAAATSVELLERKQLFVDRLTQFKEHGVQLKEGCGSTIALGVIAPFEQQAANILAVGWISKEDTDPAASTAVGEGLAVAIVGNVAEFVVTAVDVCTGKQRRGGGDSLAVLLLQNGAANDSSGGGGAAAAKPGRGKRKWGGSSNSSSEEGRASKKSKIGAAPSAAAPGKTEVVVTDNGDGTYSFLG